VKISVVIATYGDREWQALAQTRAAPSVSAQTSDVIVHHEDDGTIATSRNAAAANAPGDWLLFVDADDEIAPGYLDALRAAYTGDDRALLTPRVQTLRKGRPGAPVFFDRGISLRQDNWLILGTLVHRDLFHEVGGFGEYPHGFEDFSLWSKCFRAGATVVKVPEAVYVYHWNAQSKHKVGWRDKKWQVETHHRVVAELDAWEAARA
jgi:glycosyltransferase involved in cell wall biosynthesis